MSQIAQLHKTMRDGSKILEFELIQLQKYLDKKNSNLNRAIKKISERVESIYIYIGLNTTTIA